MTAGGAVARVVARQLAAAGVRHVVVCPGSRSTPLLLAVAAEPALRLLLHLDERAAGYFALGIARQSGRPVAVICTSGTAAANLLPAAVEASLSRVPLLLLTADRPPEQRDVGASQAVDQLRLFGAHARWSAELPCAPAEGEAPPELLAHARQLAARAVAEAAGPPAGAVQLNVPLREPLVAADGDAERASAAAAEALPLLAPARRAPLPPEPAALAALAAETAGRRGLLIGGPATGGLPAEAIARLGAALGWPILADPLSGLRTGSHAADGVIAARAGRARAAHARGGHSLRRATHLEGARDVARAAARAGDAEGVARRRGGGVARPRRLGGDAARRAGRAGRCSRRRRCWRAADRGRLARRLERGRCDRGRGAGRRPR
jgi:2-succinyl-5-enolpyruvyl-6-hydroxy-3-cyclohexene-1-carboxylate synthase